MIRVKAVKKNGCYSLFESEGHAGFARYGEDIVCAAVSALIITAGNSITELTEDEVEIREEDGFVRFEFPAPHSDQTRLLMDALLLGLGQIKEAYGKKYLKIIVREE